MLETLRGRRAGEVRTMLAEDAGPGTAFLERRGYLPTWSRLDLRLEVAHLDLNRFDNLLESVKRRGFELVSVAELAADPQRNERLYELDWLLFQDVPMGQTLTRKPFKVWVAEELEDPTFEPDLSFVVLGSRPSSQPSLQNSDPLTGPYVGYSTLMRSPGGFFVIGMTGVRREVRGLGLAKALKVAAMRALAARGGGEIRTFNDAPNLAMVGMNKALGFRRFPSRVRYELLLEKG